MFFEQGVRPLPAQAISVFTVDRAVVSSLQLPNAPYVILCSVSLPQLRGAVQSTQSYWYVQMAQKEVELAEILAKKPNGPQLAVAEPRHTHTHTPPPVQPLWFCAIPNPLD